MENKFDKSGYFTLTDISRSNEKLKGDNNPVTVYIGVSKVTYDSFKIAYEDMEKALLSNEKETDCYKEVLEQMEEMPFEKKYFSVSGFKTMIDDIDSYNKGKNLPKLNNQEKE